MDTLARRPDAVLIAAETVHDFQLQPGDLPRLRLRDGRTKQFKTVPFHYAGVAEEFPTAPSDSFLVAKRRLRRACDRQRCRRDLPLQTNTDPAAVARSVRARIGTSAQVTDIAEQRRVVGSNLTAVEMSGLTKVELGFALVLAAAASGLALGLGFHERRRTYAIAAALGARSRQLGAFVWGESAFVTGGGLLLGAAVAVVITALLVKVLTGVFDPPPDHAAVPWAYLAGVLILTLIAVWEAGSVTLRRLRRPAIEELRDL
jgi:putative ABC transport system permease protein